MKIIALSHALLIASALLWSPFVLAQAEQKPVDAALACTEAIHCPYFSAVFRHDPEVHRIVAAAFDGAKFITPDWFDAGVESPVRPIVFRAKPALIGSVCKPHWCQNVVTLIYFPQNKRIIGMSSQEEPTWIGEPDDAEREILTAMKTRGSSVNRRIHAQGKTLPLVID
jgi:hypothetical protein